MELDFDPQTEFQASAVAAPSDSEYFQTTGVSKEVGQYDATSALPRRTPTSPLCSCAGRSWDEPFALIVPPLLWRSWETLLNRENAAQIPIVPWPWSETKFHQACGSYFSWDPRRMSAERFIDRYVPDTAEVAAMTGRAIVRSKLRRAPPQRWWPTPPLRSRVRSPD